MVVMIDEPDENSIPVKGLGRIVYDGYPGCDLLPIDPPEYTEDIISFAARLNKNASDVGDGLLLFIVNELCDIGDDSKDTILHALSKATEDIESVMQSIENQYKTQEK